MPEFNLRNFDELVKQIKDIKTELVGDNDKKEKKQKQEKIIQFVTILIAIISFGMSIYTIIDNNRTDTRNYGFQRETQAYSFWLNYLHFAAENPQLANGLEAIDRIPIDSLACREQTRVKYKASTIKKFVNYAWFVANALGAAEVVSDLTTKDPKWKATIDTIINNHIKYISCNCFDKGQYSTYMQEQIDSLVSNEKKKVGKQGYLK